MALIDQETKGQLVDIPFEKGEWIRFRGLTWEQMAEAEEAYSIGILQAMSRYPQNLLDAARSQSSPNGQTPGVLRDRMVDQATLFKYGIVGWSYDPEVTPENIARLDRRTASWAFDEILCRSTIVSAEGNA